MKHRENPDPYGLEGGSPAPPAAGGAPGGDAAGAAPSPARATPRTFVSIRHGNVEVIQFAGGDVLDAHEIQRLGDELKTHIDGIETPRIVIDLGHVRHLSSAALGLLILVKTQVEGRGGSMCLANVPAEILAVFKITKLHKVMKIHKSTERAVASF